MRRNGRKSGGERRQRGRKRKEMRRNKVARKGNNGEGRKGADEGEMR